VVNVGAAGTFIVRRPIARARVRAEFSRRLPFETEIAICSARDLVGLVRRDPFAPHAARPDVVHFVSVLVGRAREAPALPAVFPGCGPWLLKVLEQEGQFVIGIYRRQMKAIGYLGKLDRLFGVPVTTRSWSTIETVADLLRSRR
jgi:uncharacterized protein (DUF1697 family)